MRKILTALFGTPTRRIITLIASNAAFYAGALGIHHYVDHVVSVPAVSFAAVALWMGWGVLNGFFTVVALGNVLLYRGHTKDFLRDDMAAMDARIDGAEVEDSEEEDLVVMRRGDGGFRFALYFVAVAAVHLLVTNSISGSFMGRYTHPGVAVVHMRSDDPAVRRNGLDMLAERLDFKATPAVEKVVLTALRDPNEGVAARATFVAGMLEISSAAQALADTAKSNEALTFVTLIALGQIGGEAATKLVRQLADDPVVRKEPLALAYAIGLTRARAIERLRELYAQGQGR